MKPEEFFDGLDQVVRELQIDERLVARLFGVSEYRVRQWLARRQSPVPAARRPLLHTLVHLRETRIALGKLADLNSD